VRQGSGAAGDLDRDGEGLDAAGLGPWESTRNRDGVRRWTLEPLAKSAI
jgi:hypothetical protein